MAALRGIKATATALLLGGGAALAMSPFNMGLVLGIVVPLFLWLLDSTRDLQSRPQAVWRCFILGWWFGFGYFVAGLYWISSALLIEGGIFVWFIPLAGLALPSVLALYVAVATALTRFFWCDGMGRLLLFAGFWTLCALLRGYLFTGFPWNLMGMAVLPELQLAQLASVVGVYGLTFLVLLVAGLPFMLAQPSRWKAAASLLVGLGMVAGAWHWGQQRLATALPMGNEADIKVRLVHPSIAQQDKWNPAHRGRILHKLSQLSHAKSDLGTIDYIIWPESAFPFMLRSGVAPPLLATLFPRHSTLITGALMWQPRPDKSTATNSIIVVPGSAAPATNPDAAPATNPNANHTANHGVAIAASYHKHHLVPFGEYLPAQGLLKKIGLRQLAFHFGAGYSAGVGPVTLAPLTVPPFSPLVCYEAIFPGAVLARDSVRPVWLLNLSNDAWFAGTAGPYQHFSQARMRSIEEGLPLVRVANQGISAFVGPRGEIIGSIAPSATGFLDGRLPTTTLHTLYSQTRGWIAYAIILLSIASGLFLRRLNH